VSRRLLCCLLLAAGVAACSSAEPADPGPLFETVSEVLESPRHGPELCGGSLEESLPPQCSGVPVAGWDWEAVEGVESLNGTTWSGRHRLVGTYDGTTFTLTEPAGPPPPPPEQEPTRNACTSPSGDEPLATFSRVDKTAMLAAMDRARSSPDFAALWTTGMDRSWEPGVRFDDVVLNVAFTGEMARHTRELREVWGGLLCVERLPHTDAELQRVQDELISVTEELGLELRSSGIETLDNVVTLTVVHATPEQRAALEERVGAGLVELETLIRPLD